MPFRAEKPVCTKEIKINSQWETGGKKPLVFPAFSTYHQVIKIATVSTVAVKTYHVLYSPEVGPKVKFMVLFGSH